MNYFTTEPDSVAPVRKVPIRKFTPPKVSYSVNGVPVVGTPSDAMLRDLRPNYESKKVKSRVPRYREHATGGTLNGDPIYPKSAVKSQTKVVYNHYNTIAGDSSRPFIKMDGSKYYDPYNDNFLERDPSTGNYNVISKYDSKGLVKPKNVSTHLKKYPDNNKSWYGGSYVTGDALNTFTKIDDSNTYFSPRSEAVYERDPKTGRYYTIYPSKNAPKVERSETGEYVAKKGNVQKKLSELSQPDRRYNDDLQAEQRGKQYRKDMTDIYGYANFLEGYLDSDVAKQKMNTFSEDSKAKLKTFPSRLRDEAKHLKDYNTSGSYVSKGVMAAILGDYGLSLATPKADAKGVKSLYGSSTDIPRHNVVSHELSHLLSLDNAYGAKNRDKLKNIVEKTSSNFDSHDNDLKEIKADFDAIRYDLFKRGYTPDYKLKKEDVPKIRSNHSKDLPYNRVLDRFNDDEFYDLFNSMVSTSQPNSSNTYNAATGGQLPYQPIGLPVNPASIREAKKEQSGFTKFMDGFGQLTASVLPALIPGVGGMVAGGLNNLRQQKTQQSQLMQYDNANYTGEVDPTQYAASGGDLPLAEGAFQVKGNPNVKDGNTYPTLNAKLDHNEVVTTKQDGGKFVYSTDLKNPYTGKSFSDTAAKYSKAIGKAEKMLKTNPYNEQAKSTISQMNSMMESLAVTQEEVAMKMGHRNPDGSTKQPGQYATGGEIPWDGFDVKKFKEWYNSQVQDPKQKIKVDSKWDNTTQNLWSNIGQKYSDTIGAEFDEAGNFKGYFFPKNSLGGGASVVNNDYTAFQSQAFNTRTGVTKIGEAQELPRIEDPMSKTLDRLPIRALGRTLVERPAYTNILTGEKVPAINQYQRDVPKTPPAFPSTATNPINGDTAVDDRYKTPYTVGDSLKFVELASKFMGLAGGPEVEKPNLDNTNITPNYYDPRSELAQNNRNFSNYSNTVVAPSINTRRALLNSAYASKLSSDSNILSQTERMNQAAKTDYQNRLSNKNRFNSQQLSYTQNLNAANRGAYDQAVQNAFTSVGRFGTDLNRKRTADDVMNLLKTQYPEIFKNVVS